MSRILGALILFALGVYGASLLRDDYRDGKAQLLLDRYRPISPIFDREADAVFFWGVTAINAGLAALFLIGGIMLIAGSLLRAP